MRKNFLLVFVSALIFLSIAVLAVFAQYATMTAAPQPISYTQQPIFYVPQVEETKLGEANWGVIENPEFNGGFGDDKQSFQGFVPKESGDIAEVKVYLGRDPDMGAAEDACEITLSIKEDDGGKPGKEVCSAKIKAGDLSAYPDFKPFTFKFPEGCTLKPGELYWMVLSASSCNETDHYLVGLTITNNDMYPKGYMGRCIKGECTPYKVEGKFVDFFFEQKMYKQESTSTQQPTSPTTQTTTSSNTQILYPNQ